MLDQAKDILQALVSFPVLGGQSNLSILEYLKSYLDQQQISYTLVPNEKGSKASLHCRIGPPVDGGVILSGHTDVVPVEGQDWTTDPFTLTEKDGKLYARGSADMKGFLACCLAAVPAMKKAGLKRPVYLAFSYDEEVGCLAGTELAMHIKATYTERPQYCIVGEPTRLKPIVGQKGIVVYKTTVNGSAGHSSRIRQEVSAIHEAARLILWLEAKMDQLIQSGHTDERFSPPHTSIHIGIIEKSGIAPNVIADNCTFFWDVRVIPQDRAADIRADFEQHSREVEQRLRQAFPDFAIQTVEHHPDVIPLDTPEKLSIVPLIREISGEQELGTVAFAAEAGQFSAVGFETVICGPGDIMQAHRADEFIEVEQLEKCLEMMERLIRFCCYTSRRQV